MIQNKEVILSILILSTASLFFLTSCSKKDKLKVPPDKIVTVEGMEPVKGVNQPKSETSSSKKPPTPVPPAKKEAPPKEASSSVASVSPRPSYSPSLPFLQAGLKKKVAVLTFENNTSYKEEKIGEAVAKKLSDKLEATQRVVTLDKTVVSETLTREGFKFDNLSDSSVIKRAYQSLGIQAFTLGTVTDVSLLSSKTSETSDEETTFATAKVEIRLIDGSTGNLLKTFIGRSPIFGTKETGEYSRGKAVLKAIDLSLEDILEGFLRQLDLLDWATTIARVEGETVYLNAGKLSGIRIGDTLEVFEPGKEIFHPATNLSLGWTTGKLKGAVRVTDLFGVDAAVGRVAQGTGFSPNDVVKSAAR
jgi:hypothetical protein